MNYLLRRGLQIGLVQSRTFALDQARNVNLLGLRVVRAMAAWRKNPEDDGEEATGIFMDGGFVSYASRYPSLMASTNVGPETCDSADNNARLNTEACVNDMSYFESHDAYLAYYYGSACSDSDDQ